MQIRVPLVVLGAIVMAAPAAPPTSSSASGEYLRSDGFMHERLTLATPGSFVYVEFGCVGGPATHEGRAEVSADRVSIEGSHGVLERELVPVAWGQRRYLVPPGQMKRFCAYVSGKTMDEPIPFFLSAEDQSKPVPSAKERLRQCR